MKFHYKVVMSFIAGFGIGFEFRTGSQYEFIIDYVLFIMIFLAGINTAMSSKRKYLYKDVFSDALLGVGFSIVGSLIAGIAFIPFIGIFSVPAALGLGWYTFTGPFLASIFGTTAGLIGFITNLSREIFGIIGFPIIKRICGCQGSISYSAAPAMDTLLPLIFKNCGDRYLAPAIIQGILSTLIAPILVASISSLL